MYEPQQLARMDLEHILHPMHNRTHNQNGPVVLVKGKGALVTDATGKEYIDAFAGLWNINVGYGRAELAEAAAAQMRDLGFSSGYAGTSNIPGILLAERLAKMAPGDLKATFFTTGGAESNEAAFKIARFYWKMVGRPDKVKVIGRQKGYHGLTAGAMSATGMRTFWRYFDPIQAGFYHIPIHYCFRCPFHKSYPECGVVCADALEQQILAEDPETVAAFIAEPVAGTGGVLVPPPEYFPKIREICDRYDVLFIADEVITGFGRTGKMFGLENWGVVPDMMSFAKGITSGYQPLGGVMMREKIFRIFQELPGDVIFSHGYTYSQHPVCCAVALRNLDIIEQEGLVENAKAMGERLAAGLKKLETLPLVGDVRTMGLMAGIELAGDKQGAPCPPGAIAKVQQYTESHGLIHRTRDDSIMLAPPLVVTENQIDTIVNILGEAIVAAGK